MSEKISLRTQKELQIVSEQDANDILQKVAPYEEHLINDYFTTREKKLTP